MEVCLQRLCRTSERSKVSLKVVERASIRSRRVVFSFRLLRFEAQALQHGRRSKRDYFSASRFCGLEVKAVDMHASGDESEEM